MTTRDYSESEKQSYDLRFMHFIIDLNDIWNFQPREQYLYTLMDKVVFEDFETAVEGTILDFENPANDG